MFELIASSDPGCADRVRCRVQSRCRSRFSGSHHLTPLSCQNSTEMQEPEKISFAGSLRIDFQERTLDRCMPGSCRLAAGVVNAASAFFLVGTHCRRSLRCSKIAISAVAINMPAAMPNTVPVNMSMSSLVNFESAEPVPIGVIRYAPAPRQMIGVLTTRPRSEASE